MVIGDNLYMVSDGGFFTCLDATSALRPATLLCSNFSASLLTNGKTIAFSDDGKAFLIEPGDTLQGTRTELPIKMQASPAVR